MCVCVCVCVCVNIYGAEAKYGIILKRFFFNLISPMFEKNVMNLIFHD